MIFVPLECLPDLFCIKCNKLLSHFPIYSNSDGSTCGRCCPHENGIRNDIYESLAKNIKFSCCYKSIGCLENLFPKDIAKHEKFCSFRKYLCPIPSTVKCNWEGFATDLLEHVRNYHPVFLLNEGYFEIDFIRSHDENYLLPYGEDLFLVNRITDSKTNIFHCTITYIGHNSGAEEAVFKLILSNNNKSYTHEIRNMINETATVSRDELKTILNDPLSVIARIVILRIEEVMDIERNSQINNDARNKKLLKALECVCCMEPMRPPIPQCIKGHSICKNCKASVTQCPTCEEEFKNTQNYILADMIDHIDYPCKYSKCKFIAKIKDVEQHETNCVFAPYPCPLRDYEHCYKNVILGDLYDHFYKDHYERVLELNTVSLPFDHHEVIEDCFIIRYNMNLFILHVRYNTQNDDIISFSTQFIIPNQQNFQYRYEIDILDASKNNHRAYFTKPCGSLTGKAEAFSDHNSEISFNYTQIEHLIISQLNFRVRIAQS